MAKKTKRKRKSGKKRDRSAEKPKLSPTPKGTTAEAVTVGWMLCLLMTLATECAGLVARYLHQTYGSEKLNILAGLLLLSSAVAGLLLLALTPVTIKLRPDPPPQPLIVAAVLVGIVPIITVLILVFR